MSGVELSSRIVQDREKIAFICRAGTKDRSRQHASRRTRTSGKQGRRFRRATYLGRSLSRAVLSVSS